MRCLMTAFVMLWAWAALAQEDGQYAPNSALGLRLENASYVVDFDERGGVAHWQALPKDDHRPFWLFPFATMNMAQNTKATRG